MKKTILNSVHHELNAKMGEFAGYEMPLQYSSPNDEVDAVRNSVGIFDVSHMGEFFVEGEDAVAFVDFLIPNDFASLPVGKALYSPLCNIEGGVIDDLIAYKLSDNFVMLCVNAANMEKDFEWLQKYQHRFNCKLENRSDLYSLIAVQGPKAAECMDKVIPKAKEVKRFGLIQLEHGEGADKMPAPTIIARTGYTGEDGFEIFVSNSHITALWNKFLEAGAKPCGLVSRDVLRIEACYPLYGNDLTEELSPLETGLKWTVKLDREDFVGKESLLKREKKFKQIKLQIEKGIPRQGYKIFTEDGTEVGKVTSGTYSPTLKKGIAMGLIDSAIDLDSSFQIEIRANKTPAQRVKKSFIENK